MTRPLHYLFALACLFIAVGAHAQTRRMDPPPVDPPGPSFCPIPIGRPGMVDSCYAYYDHAFGIGPNARVNVIKALPGGKALIAGQFTTYNGQGRRAICRVKADGGLDSTFRPGTGFNGFVNDIAVQPDGRILAVGAFTEFNGAACKGICRLLPDGALDNTFAAGTGFDSTTRQVLLTPSGKILVLGNFATYAGTARPFLARLNPNGSLDPSFNPVDTLPRPYSIALQRNGRVVFCSSYIAALDSTGALDAGFTAQVPDNQFHDGVFGAVKLQSMPNGNILAYRDYTVRRDLVQVFQLNENGSLDTSFQAGRRPFNYDFQVTDAAFDADDNILLSASWFDEGLGVVTGIVRLLPDGTRDITLPGGRIRPGVYALGVMQDGSGRLLSGDAMGNYLRAAFPDGEVDLDYNFPEHINRPIHELQAFPGGMALATGVFSMVAGEEHRGLIKITPGGNRHPDFYASRPVNSAIVQDDSTIMAANTFFTAGPQIQVVYRFSKDGSFIDSTDVTAWGNTSVYRRLIPYRNGKAFLLGERTDLAILTRDIRRDTALFRNYRNGVTISDNLIARINDVVALPGGSMVAVGMFGQAGGKPTPNIALMDSSGAVDTAFSARVPLAPRDAFPAGYISLIRRQPDGRLLVAGMPNRMKDGTAFAGLCRLNPDGTLDPGFQLRPAVPGGKYPGFTAVALQENGKILVAGDGLNYGKLERLNADGTADLTFSLEADRTDGTIHAILPVPGRPVAILGGDFTRLGGKPRSFQAQIFTDGFVALQDHLAADGSKALRLHPNPASGLLRVETTAVAELISLDGRMLQSSRPEGAKAVLDLSALKPGLYLVRSGGKAARVVRE